MTTLGQEQEAFSHGTERRCSQVSQYETLLESHADGEIRRYEDLKAQIQEMRQDIKSLTYAWQQARGVVSFVKWVAGIGGSIGAWFLFFKDHWK